VFLIRTHRLLFERSHRHTAAYVEHCSGKRIVTASTRELAIMRHLYRYVVTGQHPNGLLSPDVCCPERKSSKQNFLTALVSSVSSSVAGDFRRDI
jgi:hypothetical protein